MKSQRQYLSPWGVLESIVHIWDTREVRKVHHRSFFRKLFDKHNKNSGQRLRRACSEETEHRLAKDLRDHSRPSHWMSKFQCYSVADEGVPWNFQTGQIWPGTSPTEKSSIIVWNHLMLTWPNLCGNFDPYKMSVISHTHTNIYNA